MKVHEIIKKENRKDESELFLIYFVRYGEWWRPYEWSAYLANHFPNGLKEYERLNPIREEIKSIDGGLIRVGLKLSSFKKYLPGIPVESMTGDVVTFDASPYYQGSDITFENYLEKFNQWKESVPMEKKNKKAKEKSSSEKTSERANTTTMNCCSSSGSGKPGILSIFSEIITHPIDNFSMKENQDFLIKIKNSLLKLL